MIRVVLAVVLATALVGIGAPIAERVERDRNAELATGELEALASTADRLAATNDPVAAVADPAGVTVELRPPNPTVTAGGRFVLADDRLHWQPRTGPNRTVDAEIPIRVDGPILVSAPTHLRLTYVIPASIDSGGDRGTDGDDTARPVIWIQPADGDVGDVQFRTTPTPTES